MARAAKAAKRLIPRMLAAVVVFLSFGEIATRMTSVDRKLLSSLIYIEGDFRPNEMISPGWERHYCLRPGSRHVYWNWLVATVNAAGYRGRERPARKPPGVYRVVCFGGSNVFGAAVGDGKTYPAQLERELNKRYPGRFEVWNAGTCAYVLSQDIAAARRAITLLDPDMMIFTVTNRGRRAFNDRQERSFLPFFDAVPALYWENLYFLPWGSTGWNQAFLKHWRFYRLAMVAANDALRIFMAGVAPLGDREVRDRMRSMATEAAVMHQPAQAEEAALRRAVTQGLREDQYESAIRAKVDRSLNDDAFLGFYEQFRKRFVILLASNPAGASCDELRDLRAPCLPLKESLSPQAPLEYRLIHPGARVYHWYAKTLARLIGPRLRPTEGRVSSRSNPSA